MSWWGKFIGLPYAQAHCWELVRRVYAERLGVDLPTYGEIDARDLVRVERAIEGEQERWQPVSVPQALDVVLMRGRSRVCHVGVMTDARHVLHSERATDAVRVRVNSLAGRITGYWRYAA